MDRRRALVLFVNSVLALIGGSLSAVLGAFARPLPAAGGRRWRRAGALADLTANVPVPRVVTVSRQDGWFRVRSPQTVFVVWTGGEELHAFSATCTHLGCQVRWDRDAARFQCPCHGGAYDAQGQVVAGPPSRPLDRLDARIEGTDRSVMVRL